MVYMNEVFYQFKVGKIRYIHFILKNNDKMRDFDINVIFLKYLIQFLQNLRRIWDKHKKRKNYMKIFLKQNFLWSFL